MGAILIIIILLLLFIVLDEDVVVRDTKNKKEINLTDKLKEIIEKIKNKFYHPSYLIHTKEGLIQIGIVWSNVYDGRRQVKEIEIKIHKRVPIYF